MECKTCKMECIGETPCTRCKEPVSKKAILKKTGILFVAFIIFYWIGVVV